MKRNLLAHGIAIDLDRKKLADPVNYLTRLQAARAL